MVGFDGCGHGESAGCLGVGGGVRVILMAMTVRRESLRVATCLPFCVRALLFCWCPHTHTRYTYPPSAHAVAAGSYVNGTTLVDPERHWVVMAHGCITAVCARRASLLVFLSVLCLCL